MIYENQRGWSVFCLHLLYNDTMLLEWGVKLLRFPWVGGQNKRLAVDHSTFTYQEKEAWI